MSKKITMRVKTFNQNEDGSFKLVENKYDTLNVNYFNKQVEEVKIPVEYVAAEPEKFKFSTLYIRNDYKTAWLYVEN